jgi:phosphoribosylamine--glycine ligase
MILKKQDNNKTNFILLQFSNLENIFLISLILLPFMRILLVGSGGREHALAWKLKQSEKCTELFCCPGNAGTAELGKNIDIAVENITQIIKFAQDNLIDLVVVGPETPLVIGLVDELEKEGIKAFGPSRAAAELEGSKAFAKKIMKRYNIPTAEYNEFSNAQEALTFLDKLKINQKIVIKADGLAAGKGVIICENACDAKNAINQIMVSREFGGAGDKVIIEEFLEGEEASYLVFSDGKNVVPMVSSQDHKRIFDNDLGPNTGGMGAYSPAPIVTKEVEEKVMNKIIYPMIKGMNLEGKPFKGVLYAGLMIHNGEPKVVEFNARFGDPETEVILPRLESDLVEIMLGCIGGTLLEKEIKWSNKACTGVVMAAKGYPGNYPKGDEITGIKKANSTGAIVFQAGTKLNEGKIVTNGGRVLVVSALGDTIKESISNAYRGVREISFEGAQYRKDIGQKALKI